MPETQNLTIRLEKATVRKARVLAARRGTSITRLVRDIIEREVRADDAYDVAQQRALAALEAGLPLGGGPYLTRDESHER